MNIEHQWVLSMEAMNIAATEPEGIDLRLSDEKCLPDLLWEQAQICPDRTAVIYGQQVLTYRELVQNSFNLARYFQYLGVTPDDCIGIFTEPSLELMIGTWGILFSGSAYLPLSPEYPEERLRYMIKDSRIKIIFSQKNLKVRLNMLVPEDMIIVTLDDVAAFITIHGMSKKYELSCELNKDNLAYIIYTSGSTGKPKGVMIEHHSIVNQMHWLQKTFNLNDESVVLQKTPVSFDAAQWEVLASCLGCTVIMGKPGIYRNPEELIKTITRHRVTTLQCVPTLLQMLLDTVGFLNCRSLTKIFSGGEVLSKNLASQCLELLPKCDLINLYGPTECTINTSAHVVDRETVTVGPNAISIGMPVLNTQYYILDNKGSQTKLEEIGELFIAGKQLARGYLHKPDLTADRFVANPFAVGTESAKLYRTGDLAFWNTDGTVQFSGRADNQIKLGGFRIELDEIRLVIEDHSWVKNAVILIKIDAHTKFQNLIAYIELNQAEAALMDQGSHGSHHQSKESKLQVKAQLSNTGCRNSAEISNKVVIELPGKMPNDKQRHKVFARKTYRLYEGGCVSQADIAQLLSKPFKGSIARSVAKLSFAELGEILRYFGQFLSLERLLPKYGYASPGALYATQMYFELSNMSSLNSGIYYYHPVKHQLILMREIAEKNAEVQIKIHFMGKKRAIEPVYKNNIQEVLEIETGHMLGLFDNVLPVYGLGVGKGEFIPAVKNKLECADEDYYLGSFKLESLAEARSEEDPDIYVQTHSGKVADLPMGQYQFKDDRFEKISEELILKKHVIAINQQVYDYASFGISMVSRDSRKWMRYISLGRKLQLLQMNDLNLGLMSSGYSSKTGNNLPSAKRMAGILTACGREMNSFYFCLGGRISDAQRESEGMKEDAIHMKGPVEMIKNDLFSLLPNYMVPNKIILIDKLPLTANGKTDHKALTELEAANDEFFNRPLIAPKTQTEERIGEIWKLAMKQDAVSVQDDFFESGGNSLMAVSMINDINKKFQCSLPLQVLFAAPTIEKLARRVDGEDNNKPVSRLVSLAATGNKPPVYCWPGLGGYTMNLRLLANQLEIDRPFYGVQAYGINQGETPFSTITEMATTDIKAIKRVQSLGPYILWGYSFGARVAFEVAYQLEQSGERVDNLFLIAPGSPKLHAQIESLCGNESTFENKTFVTILFSVFAHSIASPALDECLKAVKDEANFIAFICSRYKHLDPDLVKRITQVVRQTYEFEYTFRELKERKINAPITIFKARSDDYSFLENSQDYSMKALTVINLESDHYSLLKRSGINELVSIIHGFAASPTTKKFN